MVFMEVDVVCSNLYLSMIVNRKKEFNIPDMAHLPALLIVSLGGGLGAAFRYLLSGAVYRVAGTDFPYGTLVINVLGSLLLGWLMETSEYSATLGPNLRLFLGVGVCGGFTTFSTFSYETMQLLSTGNHIEAFMNIVGSVLLCLIGVYVGMILARVV
jgi:fluoride exporter